MLFIFPAGRIQGANNVLVKVKIAPMVTASDRFHNAAFFKDLKFQF